MTDNPKTLTDEEYDKIRPYIDMFWEATWVDFTDPVILSKNKLFQQILRNQKIVERLEKRLDDLESKDDNDHFWVFVEGGVTTANDDFRKELLKILGRQS